LGSGKWEVGSGKWEVGREELDFFLLPTLYFLLFTKIHGSKAPSFQDGFLRFMISIADRVINRFKNPMLPNS